MEFDLKSWRRFASQVAVLCAAAGIIEGLLVKGAVMNAFVLAGVGFVLQSLAGFTRRRS